MHRRMPLVFLAARAHCWLMVNLSSTRTPRSLSAEMLSSRSTPSLYWCMGLFLPTCRTLHLPLLNLIRFQSAELSSLSRSRWTTAQPSGVSTTPPSLVSSANLLRVHSSSSSRSLMKKLNKTGPSTDSWGTPVLDHWSFLIPFPGCYSCTQQLKFQHKLQGVGGLSRNSSSITYVRMCIYTKIYTHMYVCVCIVIYAYFYLPVL